MVSINSLPSLSPLKFTYDSDGDRYWIPVGDWTEFLRNHLTPRDKWREVKSSNIIRIFEKDQTDFLLKEEKGWTTLSALIGFAYHHKYTLESCRTLVKEIELKILGNTEDTDNSRSEKQLDLPIQNVLELYKLVADSNIGDQKIQDLLLPGIQIENRQIETLVTVHKDNFSKEEWAKICLFEWHFSQVKCVIDMTYENQLMERYKFYQQCQEVVSLAATIQKQGRDIACKNIKRREYGESMHNVQIYGRLAHNPSKIDSELTEAVNETLCATSLVSTGCNSSCQHQPGIHVFLEIANLTNLKERTEVAMHQINNYLEQHGDVCQQMILFKEGSFSDFRTKGKQDIRRFELHDAINSKAVDNQIVKRINFEHEPEDENDAICELCFPQTEDPPLHWKSLNLIQEWLLYVPLFLQIILGVFINKVTLKRSSNKHGLLMSKIVCLYSVFERLLNLQNRNYFGVVQELNTDELVFNYHSVGTVFSITSRMGITQSLKSAERRLKLYSAEDLCYFNTYLKRYPLKYESVSGLKEESVSLQNCYLAFCVDNLVRLSFKQDKERNETKSTQIATLPMTLKGIPKDLKISESWHDEEICDGSDKCLCKREKILKIDDLKPTLLEPNEKEEIVLENFKSYMTWSWTTTWLKTSGYQKLQNLLQEAAKQTETKSIQQTREDYDGSYNDNTVDLDISLMSLNVPEDEEIENLDASMKSIQLSGSEESDKSSSCISDEDDEVSSSETSSESSAESESDARISCSDSELDSSILQNRSFEEDINNANQNNSISTVGEKTTTDKSEQSGMATEMDNQECSGRDESSFDHTNEEESEKLLTFGFSVYQPPPMICRHPPPAIGRDDSITKLREVLDEVLIKSGNYSNSSFLDSRILFAPDQKIGSNLLKLHEQDTKYRVFLPEFPLLHLRKSKITNLCTGYKDAGIVQLLMYMNDDEKEKDWMKLVEATHIEHATRNIKRLSLTIHLFLMVLFIRSLSADAASEFLLMLDSGKVDGVVKWAPMFDTFLERSRKKNATFSLHCDIMKHCDEVLAIAAAERLGGPDGYYMLLGAVKKSLPFAFLNGATSYGAFCVRLLIAHYGAGPFYQGMKHCLFSTRHKESDTNIALDQQRDMDHRDALKGFRPRATVESVLPRMTQVDRMAEIRATRLSIWGKSDMEDANDADQLDTTEHGLSWKLTEKDVSHVIPTLQMMLRANDTITKDDLTPKNVYGVCVRTLSDAILDETTFEVGKYLIIKYVCRSGLLGHSEKDIPILHNHLGPTELMQKVTRGKGVVVKRATCKSLTVDDQRSAREKKRKQGVDKMVKVYDCLSSDMNMCQAVIKPDCTKGPVAKSLGIKSALFWCLQEYLQYVVYPTTPIRDKKKKSEEDKRMKNKMTTYLAENGIVIYSAKTIPQKATENVKVAIVEFAGAKYKTFAMTGRQYLEFVETAVINKIKTHFKTVKRMIICEEKYHFTPNDLKGPTRQKRISSKGEASIYHLKKRAEIVSAETFDKRAATKTTAGKATVGLFLAENIPTLKLSNLLIDIDSEMLMEGCQCGTTAAKDSSACDAFAIPVAEFGLHGFVKQTKLSHIKQRKGEAEMAMVDWLRDCLPDLNSEEGVVAYVTSGDIDAVVIHMFALSIHWPRKTDSSFCYPVYVILQKLEGQHDVYCITRIIEIIEKRYGIFSGVHIAVGLALGGNDFFPKFHGKSHKKMLQTFVENHYMWSLLDIGRDDDGIPVSATVNNSVFVDYIKHVYCQSNNDPQKLSFEALRQSTIKMPGQSRFKPPNHWLPPKQALHQLALLLECQIEYLFTAWCPDTKVPNFAAKGCLKVNDDGFVEYDFGGEVRVEKQEELLVMNEEELKDILKTSRRKSVQHTAKRGTQDTPQKRRKIKRRLITSTPRKTDS